MALKIMYRFMDDEKIYLCYVTYEQYKNLKALPIVKECNVIKRNAYDHDEYTKEMQKAIKSLSKDNPSHILRLSKNV